MVGLPRDSNAYPDGTSVILVGLVHEFGSIVKGIPERSYLRSTIRENRRAYKKFMADLAKSVVQGKRTIEQAKQLLGLKVASDVQEKITTLDTPPLKYRDGNPLIDTGHLRQSITFVVRKL